MQRPDMNDFASTPNANIGSDGLIEAYVIPMRDLVLFPNMAMPVYISRKKTVNAMLAAQKRNETLIGVAQYDSDNNDPNLDDLYTIGTEMVVGKLMHMPDNSHSALAQGRRRVEIVRVVSVKPYLRVKARPMPETYEQAPEVEASINAAMALFEHCCQLSRSIPDEAYIYALNITEPGWLADMIISVLELDFEERQSLLEHSDPVARLQQVIGILGRLKEVLEIEAHITNQVQNEIDHSHRELYLREQMRAIQNELGESDPYQSELMALREKIEQADMPAEAYARAHKEMDRLLMMPPMAPEVGIVRTYLDWLADLPWGNTSKDNLDVLNAANVLDKYHFGLAKIKDRILEHIAVRKLAAEKMKTPILCFVGPPGTGKTSLGRSIAEALGRQFGRRAR
jgi:ATP-dependent Lon protease